MPYIGFIYTQDFTSVSTGVTVTTNNSSGVSYESVQAALGTTIFLRCRDISIYALNQIQLIQPYRYAHFGGTGNINELVFSPLMDPGQRQSKIDFELENRMIIFDGTTALFVDVQPNSTLQLTLSNETLNRSDYLEANKRVGKFFKDFFSDNNDGF